MKTMKLILIQVLVIGMLVTSCNSTKTQSDTDSNIANTTLIEPNTELTNENPIIDMQHADIENDEQVQKIQEEHKTSIAENLAVLSHKSTIGDCYLLDAFMDDGLMYVTVDFVSYVKSEYEPDQGPEYVLAENTVEKITFVSPSDKYYKCGHSDEELLNDLLKIAEEDSSTIFRLEVKDGVIKELFIDTCSG